MTDITEATTITETHDVAALREEERSRISREEKLRHEMESMKQKLSSYEDKEQRLKKSGWDPDAILNAENVFKPRDTKYDALENQISELTKRLQETQSQTQRQTYLGDIRDYVRQNADDFELIRLHKAENDVLGLIEKNYNSTGSVLTYHEACQKIEAQIEKSEKERAKIIQNSKKAKSFYYGEPAPQTPEKKVAPKKDDKEPAAKEAPTSKVTTRVPITPKSGNYLGEHVQNFLRRKAGGG